MEDLLESSNAGTSCQEEEVKEEQQKKMTHRKADHYRTWPGEPWIDSQAMSIKLAVPIKGDGWSEAQYSYWGIYRQVPILWGTMGAGCPVYHEPTCFIQRQDDKGSPILRMVLWGQLICEQQIFNDLRIQSTEHSIRRNWSALKKDAQLRQRIAQGAMIQPGYRQQNQRSQVLEPENAARYLSIPHTRTSLERKKEPSMKRDRQSSEKLQEGQSVKKIKLGGEESVVEALPHQETREQEKREEPSSSLSWIDGLVPLYHGSTEIIQPKEHKHMTMHEHFCRRRYCKYHNTA